MAEAVAARTTTIASLVSKALNANGNGNNEPPHIRARREADTADRDYRITVRKLDRQRLGLEERVEETLKTLQKWELDRLRAVKTGTSRRCRAPSVALTMLAQSCASTRPQWLSWGRSMSPHLSGPTYSSIRMPLKLT